MTLSLDYFQHRSTCPFPVNLLRYCVLLATTALLEHRKELEEWRAQTAYFADLYGRATTLRREIKFGLRTSLTPEEQQLLSDCPEMKPWSKLSYVEEVFGESVEVPSQLHNPMLYVWTQRGRSKEIAAPPMFPFLLLEGYSAAARFNAAAHMQVRLRSACEAEGLHDEYDAPFLWFVFSGRADQYEKTQESIPLAHAMGHALLPYWLETASDADIWTAVTQVMTGIRKLYLRG